jgi:Trk-type K+ transport system membrane component
MGIPTSQVYVTGVTASLFTGAENRLREAHMPILMLALIALGVFGLIGLLLVLAVSLERKNVGGHEPHDKAA